MSSPPPMVVLVVGPRLAGVDGVVAALRERLRGLLVAGFDELDPECAPDAVVAVVSAVAPMTESDRDLIVHAAARTEMLVGAVSKIDAHRTWREVLAADRDLFSRWVPSRRAMPWVGVAAAPRLGEPNVDRLAAVLTEGLADPSLRRRNEARCIQYRTASQRDGRRRDDVDARVTLQQVRLRLLRFVRDGCAAMRVDLRDAASTVPAGGSERFAARVRDDVAYFFAELDGEVTRAIDSAADDLGFDGGPDGLVIDGPASALASDVVGVPSASRTLETRLMAVLGLGFGLGVALAASRMMTGLAPDTSIAGWVVGAMIGSALVVWVVRTRGVLHDRALLDRWVTEVAATSRWHGEAVVAERLLAVEAALLGARRTPRNGTRSGY